jgi:5-methylcytosine-specific restriction protein A
MTKRREFSKAIKVQVVKRTTRDGVTFCEKCGAIAKRWQIDHVIADAHGGEPVIENAELICEPCYSIKNPKDTTIAAKLKRIEAKALGVRKTATMKTTKREPAQPQRRATRPLDKPQPPRRPMFEEAI